MLEIAMLAKLEGNFLNLVYVNKIKGMTEEADLRCQKFYIRKL